MAFSSITNAFGWGDKAPAAPAAPPPPTTAPTTAPAHDPTPKPSQDVTKDAGKTQIPRPRPTPKSSAGRRQDRGKAGDPKMVRDSANKLFKAMDGWGTDEDALLGRCVASQRLRSRRSRPSIRITSGAASTTTSRAS